MKDKLPQLNLDNVILTVSRFQLDKGMGTIHFRMYPRQISACLVDGRPVENKMTVNNQFKELLHILYNLNPNVFERYSPKYQESFDYIDSPMQGFEAYPREAK